MNPEEARKLAEQEIGSSESPPTLQLANIVLELADEVERLRHVLDTCETRKTSRSMLHLYDEVVAEGKSHDVWPGMPGEKS